MRRLLAILLAAAMSVVACGGSGPSEAATVRTMATGLQVPWGLAFLPNGDALVSERLTGRILRVPRRGGRARVVMRIASTDTHAGEGGLLGLAVSPNYARDRLVYAYVTTGRDNRIVRFRLGGAVRPIFTGIARGFNHNGGRLAFGPDGRLYATTGDAGNSSRAQTLSSPNGKILRMTASGGVAPGNPFRRSRVWTWGHRNVQGLAWDRRGRAWAPEFGQNTTDEVNQIIRGHNYGWPNVEGRGGTAGGRFTNPKVTWSPTSVSSPSGAAARGNRLYVGALRSGCLWSIPIDGASLGRPRKLLAGRFGRIRTVVRAPDGALWVTTSNRDGRGSPRAGDDRILRVVP
jgi:glucose/arabinose dehydrogenase